MSRDRSPGFLPPYLAGTLLLRGRKRLVLTMVLVLVQVTFSVWVQAQIGHHTYSVIAPIVFVIAWEWGRVPGAIYAAVTVVANYALTTAAGVPEREIASVAIDTGALAVVAFTVGHVGLALERALGARAKAKEAYGALEAAARDRMLTITDQVPIGLYRTTPDGEIIGGNDALVRILGFPDYQSMLATNVLEHYVNAEDRTAREITSKSSQSEWSEFQLRRNDGTVIWVRDWAVAIADENGEPLYFDGVLEDITATRAADERFRAAFEDSPYGMTISTTDGFLIRANEAIAELLGRPFETLTNIHFSQFTFEDEMDITPKALAKAEAGETVRYEKRLKRPDGSYFWALISLAPIRGAEDPQLFISHVIDITEKQQVREGLENLVRSKDELIASVSHELRTPLTVVHGLAQELDSNWMSFTVPEQKEFIGLISQQSAEVAHIVEDLLVAARADIGKLPIHPATLDLRTEIDAVLPVIPELNATIERVGDAAPAAFADPSRVRQITRNLLSNAGRYGGPEVRVRYGSEGGRTWMEVADNGLEIPPSEVAKIFEPYERAHNAQGQPMSVGLGLTVSRTLAELMGGSLSYRYEEKWSIFRLELPVPGAVHSGR